MKYIFSIALFLLRFIFFAQPTIEWAKTFGGSEAEQARSIQQTNDDGYIVTGYTVSNNGDVIGNHGANDIWVLKLSNTGVIQWKKSLGGSNNDWSFSIQNTTDNGYIVAGYTESNDGDVSGNHGNKDFWVVKLNSAGTIQWQKTLGGSGWDEAWCIRQTLNGGYIVAGRSRSQDGDVTGNHGSFDFWVVKLNSDGDLEWQKSLGGSSSDIAYSIRQCPDGGYIVVGDAESNDGDANGLHGSSDYWVVKLSLSGEIEWQKMLGSSSLDRANDVLPTSDGGYIVIGEISANNGDVTGHHGGYDYWAVKLSGSGDIQWQKTLGGSNEDYGKSIQQTIDGGYIIAGATTSTDGDILDNDGGLDFWVVKLTDTGEIKWQKTLGGTQGDWANSVQQTNNGGYIVAGYTLSNNGDVSGFHGTQDFWVVKLSPLSTSTSAPQPAPLAIYPNPTHQFISVQLPAPSSLETGDEFPLSIRITDLPGREVMRQTNDNEAPLNIEAIPNGLYLLTATTNSGKVFSGKFVKQE